MRKILFFTMVLILGTSALAMAAILDFEDLYTGSETAYHPIESPYHGFTMSDDCGFITKYHTPGTGYEVGTTGNGSMYNAYERDINLSMTTAFSVETLDVTLAWYAPQTSSIFGYKSGSLIYTYVANFTNTAVSHITLNWTGIDELYFSSGGSRQLCIDNIVYNSVPLPPSMLLFGSGILGLVGLRRFRKS